ncbi:hypothetical protein [Bacillus rhizoplanae]|uniref:hypothetical protein n=1 Tax=Bacillus rhizoplanae TaxID=2880966 RepID=UPI003D1BBB8B
MIRKLPLDDKRPWLTQVYKRRNQRSFDLGKKAIDLLVKQGLSVTFSTVSEKTKEIDPEGKGIHWQTVKSNEALYEYYKQHSKTYKQRSHSRRSAQKDSHVSVDYENAHINADRNRDNALRRLMKLSKMELAQRLFDAEQYIAENRDNAFVEAFEQYAVEEKQMELENLYATPENLKRMESK